MNSIIKINRLIELLNKNKIARIKPDALDEIEKRISKELLKKVEKISQSLSIQGKKILTKRDVEEAFERKEEYPEI